ncbi:hypothetical protein H634G_04030 [Metarhizium anisopliae BRIP 53293]|uniref:Major facilitator superfamily (MFS) profile domain-containing protein n=1 Tax=Metarhizium anisopliae BRIP 53293 TaxID=1291518 RepID=A0A0D9P452_METAN|nr:hypothetical protein H634G_04030 [Metarhizium anisopliae BRIP 53293]
MSVSVPDEKTSGRENEKSTALPMSTKKAQLQASTAEPDVESPQTQRPGYDPEAERNYQPKTLKFWLIVLSVFVSMFLVALDRTILATAVPRITDEFKSLGDIGWYASAYMLTTAACQLLFGRVYKFYSTRRTFLATIVVFEVGSALCGAAPSSPAFIVGRAIAGVGAAGIWTGSMMAIIPMVPLHKRPMFQGVFGMVFGISSVVGPLIGGAFTERATWRWCFYLNLPVGAVAFALLFLFMHPADTKHEPATLRQQLVRLDPMGTFFFVPSVICLLLALQWGGSTYAWGSWRIILLLVMFGLAALAFAAVQVQMPETAALPVRLIKQRTVLAGTFYMLFLAGGMMLVVYYLPLWFQATKGVDPVKSGVYTIPLVLSLVVASIVSGAGTQRIGYYTPFMIASPCIAAVGEGLLTTFTPEAGSNRWIGFQFLTGFGVGLGMQSVGLAVQATLPREDVSTGIAITFFAQQLGGAVFVSVGQTILSTLLVEQLSGVPGLDPMSIVKTGATELRHVVPSQFFGRVVDAYNFAITRIFYCALALALAQLVSALFVEWRSIKKSKDADAGKAVAQQEGLGE